MEKKLRAAVIGLSGISERPASPGKQPGWGTTMPHSHVAAYAFVDDTELVAVCDLREDLLKKFQGDWKDSFEEVNTYTDYKQMLAKENLDILSVVTSDHVHAQMVVDGAGAGVKGILCEKPLATTIADADRMTAAVEKAGIPLIVDHTRRWMFPWVQAGQAIKDGVIGDVVRVMANQGGPRAMLFRNGTHMGDTINWFAGGSPVAVYARSEKGFENYGPKYASDGGHDPNTDPAMSIMVEYDNDVRAFWNMCKPMVRVFEVDVLGTKGRITVAGDSAIVSIDDEKMGMLSKQLPREQYTQGHISGALTELVHLIKNGGTPSCGVKEGKNALSVLLAALQSQAKGNVRIQLPIRDA